MHKSIFSLSLFYLQLAVQLSKLSFFLVLHMSKRIARNIELLCISENGVVIEHLVDEHLHMVKIFIFTFRHEQMWLCEILPYMFLFLFVVVVIVNINISSAHTKRVIYIYIYNTINIDNI